MMKKTILPVLALMLMALPAVHAQGDTTPVLAWSFPTDGEIWGGITVVDGVAYFGNTAGNLYAVDAKSGQEIWHFTAGDQIRSRPAVTDTLVYVNCDDGYLYAVNRQDGTEAWRGDVGTEVAARLKAAKVSRGQWDYQQSSPAVADGIVYVGGISMRMFAFDAATGAELWRFEVEKSAGAVRSSPTVVDGAVYIGGAYGAFYALNAKTGEQIWTADLVTEVRPTATVVDGVIYIGSRNPWLVALDAGTGSEIWRFSYGASWVESTANVVDGVVYIGSSDAKRLYAIDAASGESIWEFRTPGYPWCSPAVADGVVYIGDVVIPKDQPHFYAVNAQTGEPIWTFQTGEALDYNYNGVVSAPAVVDGLVYFGALDGTLYALETASAS